ncbi:MAG: hypothetical protein AB7N80_14960, partial [Bdellovibrionales bacterium]
GRTWRNLLRRLKASLVAKKPRNPSTSTPTSLFECRPFFFRLRSVASDAAQTEKEGPAFKKGEWFDPSAPQKKSSQETSIFCSAPSPLEVGIFVLKNPG